MLFIVAGIGYVQHGQHRHRLSGRTPGCAEFMPFGFSGVMTGAAVIFFAYIGFDAVSTAAQEAKNPQRDMPIGIMGSLAICTVLYILVAGIMVGLVDYKLLDQCRCPIAVAIDAALKQAQGTTMGTVLAVFPTIIKVGAVLGLKLDNGRDDNGSAACFLLDVQGRFAAGMGGKDPSEIPNAAHHDGDHRSRSSRSWRALFRSVCSVNW